MRMSARILPLAMLDAWLQALITLCADPLASLVSTGWVGRLGTTELAGVGVALRCWSCAVS